MKKQQRTLFGGRLKRVLVLSVLGLLLQSLSSVTYAGPRNTLGAALDPAARISDFYMFRSWEDPSKLVLIVNSAPGQDPGDGPGYFGFNDDVVYRINIDNDTDGEADDIIYEIRFKTESRPAYGELTFPLPYVGNPFIQSRPELRGVTAIDGTGSEGLTLRQTYTIYENRDGDRTRLFAGQNLIAAPSNVGPVTMPDYESLAAQAIYEDGYRGIRVFAGQRADAFYGDMGALFDGAAPRRFPPVLTEAEEFDDTRNPFGLNRNEGFNVQSIVLEIPIARVTEDEEPANETEEPFIGAYASAGRYKTVRGKWSPRKRTRKFKQVSRMGNGMINTLIIDVPNKDKFNRANPENDADFFDLISDPPLARPPTSEIFGIPIPPTPRADLVNTYLKYPGQTMAAASCGEPCADLLRLNVIVPPTPAEQQSRLGSLIGGDPAGMPNGRRPHDDVVDFTVRMIGGPGLIFARLGDGVNYASGVPGAGFEDGPGYGRLPGNKLDVTVNGIVKEFPYLPTPHNGRFHSHGN